jgi:hypothetical protein
MGSQAEISDEKLKAITEALQRTKERQAESTPVEHDDGKQT